MDGKIFNSEGQYVAIIIANQVYNLSGQKLYDLRGQKIYKLTGEFVGHLISTGADNGSTNRATDCFPNSRISPAGRAVAEG
ncbi:hypothetical protein [Bradyrhizobium sp. JYMT SZCCT0428]|uniref:hypothetical protein n=1 Tax=Bradyrhizobium sp. JYMT SZCCT0428 TaxID=2807673 RepID=UPI00201102B3|nr:hypothetical protein [Bradyrhizobium sp. JYMT SZCCT0428]